MRGGSGPPWATLSRAPIFRSAMRFSSRMSTDRPDSLAMAAAFSARILGVSRLEGSLTRSRAKFWASAMMRPLFRAFSPADFSLSNTCDGDGFDRFVVLFVGFVFVGLEIGGDGAFGYGLGGVFAQVVLRGPGRLAFLWSGILGSAERLRRFFLGWLGRICRASCPYEQEAGGFQACWCVDQGHFERLATEFGAGGEFI